MSTEDMNAALDQLGIGALDDNHPMNEPQEPAPQASEPQEPVEPTSLDNPPADDVPADDPPGYLDHDAWVAKYGNDDKWKGKKAYEEEYQRVQERNQLADELANQRALMNEVVDATRAMQEKSYKEGLAEAKAELNQALDDNDAEAALRAKEKMDNLSKPKQAAPALPPVIDNFIQSNPMLDNRNPQFDQNLHASFQRIYNNALRSDGVQPEDRLTEGEVQSYLNYALNRVKELNGDKFESPRNTRSSVTPTNKRPNTKPSASANLKGVGGNPHNQRDSNAASEIYELIKAKNPEMAETFANNLTGANQ